MVTMIQLYSQHHSVYPTQYSFNIPLGSILSGSHWALKKSASCCPCMPWQLPLLLPLHNHCHRVVSRVCSKSLLLCMATPAFVQTWPENIVQQMLAATTASACWAAITASWQPKCKQFCRVPDSSRNEWVPFPKWVTNKRRCWKSRGCKKGRWWTAQNSSATHDARDNYFTPGLW